MYYKKWIKAGRTIAIHKTYKKRTGVAERGKKEKPTKEEMEKVNQCNAERKLTLLLNANYKDGDFHLVLTYYEKYCPTPLEAKEQIGAFIDNMRKAYKKMGTPFKYVHVTEYLNKRIHHHLVINNIEDKNVTKLIKSLWEYGNPKFVLLNTEGQYKNLAEYLIKETSKTYKEKKDKAHKQRYSCSRNLIRPKEKESIVKADKWLADPKPPKGYYVDLDTLENGIDKWTGREYQRYMLVQIVDNVDNHRKKLSHTVNTKWERKT